MKYFSLFSGIGGFELGILYSQQTYDTKYGSKEEELAWGREYNNKDMSKFDSSKRLSCIGFSEIDKYATQIYKKHFPEHKEYGDVSKIDWTIVPDFDLLVGGFPCQAFSIAGKRGGFDDTRGTLFFEIARCLKQKRPRLCLLENVKGLLSHDKGSTFFTILATLDELGYDLQWQVLNSKNFGVPQNRERVFIVGHLRGTSRPEVFPIGRENSITCIEAGTIQAISGHDILKRAYSTKGLSPVLNTCGGGNTEGKFVIDMSQSKREKHPRTYHNTAPCCNQRDYKEPRLVKDGLKIRRLTPTECERLQGFPDGWTEGLSDTQRYKCLGNAVTVNVITAIITKLLQADIIREV